VLFFILLAVWTVTGHQLLSSTRSRDPEELLHRHDAIRALMDEQIDKNADPVEKRPLEGP